MGYTKKVAILILISSYLFSFSQKPLKVDKENFALLNNITNSCYQEVENNIKNMLDTKILRMSKKPFSDSSYLDITNSSQRYFQFLLHKFDDELYISKIKNQNIILESKKLKSCR